MENPAGLYDAEYDNLLTKSNKWKSSILYQHMTRQELHLFYKSFYLPSIRYHLTVGTFSASQLEKIQHPLIQILIQRMGFNSNMPKQVIYGPTSAGGMGYTHLFPLQAQQKIKLIFQAYRNNTPLKYILHTTFQWAQHITGLSTSIFHNNYPDLPLLSSEKWLTTLCQYLYQSNMKLHIPELQMVTPKRQHDAALMDLVMSDNTIALRDKKK